MNPESSTDEAAAWAARLDAGPLNPAEAGALMHWLESDPVNESCLEEMQQLHGKVRLVLPEMVATGRLPTPKPRSVRRPVWAWAGAVVAMLAFAAVWFVQRPMSYSTKAGEVQTVTLADGTRAEMNALTILAVRLRAGERQVQLKEGEAFFAVAKDQARPFFVKTTAGVVRVTGTVFNVRAETGDSLTVTVVEGSVAVTLTAGGQTYALKPGDELSIESGRIEQRHLATSAVEDTVAWREGRIVFNNTPLKEALERFARYHGQSVEVSPGAQTLQLGGRFKLDDFDAFLRDVQVALPVRVLRGSDGHVRVVPQ